MHENGLEDAVIHRNVEAPTLSGSDHSTKPWTVIVTNDEKLIAVIDITAHTNSFTQPALNDFFQKTIAAGHNFQKAYREGAFGNFSKPFVGSITVVVGDSDNSNLQQCEHFCRRMMMERLYAAACYISVKNEGRNTGPSRMTRLKSFATALAWHVVVEAAKVQTE